VTVWAVAVGQRPTREDLNLRPTGPKAHQPNERNGLRQWVLMTLRASMTVRNASHAFARLRIVSGVCAFVGGTGSPCLVVGEQSPTDSQSSKRCRYRDGSTHVVMEPQVLIERLLALGRARPQRVALGAKCFTKPNPKERAACAVIAAVNYAWCTGLCIGAEGVCYLEEVFRPRRAPLPPSVNRAAHQALNEAMRHAS
jgi:hypothetical protein